MSDGIAVGLGLVAAVVVAGLIGYLLAYLVVGHNPLHRGRCMDQPAEIRRAQRRASREVQGGQ